MPLEIRELVIKVTIEEHPQHSAGQQSSKDLHVMKDKIVQECMEKILNRIENLSVR